MQKTLNRAPQTRVRSELSDRGVANLFLLPTVLLLVAMNVFPLFWSLYLSFTRYVATNNLAKPAWIGGKNYSDLLSDPDTWKYFQVTAEFTALAVGCQLIVGFGLALLLNRQFRARGLVTTLILLPMMLSPVVVGLFWRFMLDSQFGLVNWALQLVHLQDPAHPWNWLNDASLAMWSLVLVDTWMWSPFVMLISLAGLSAVPPHLHEAAEVDRASTWFKFRHITLPMVGPLVLIALLFRTIDCFKIFDLVYVLTGGGPGDATKTVSYSLFKQAFDAYNTGYSCALGYIILLVIIGLANLYMRHLARLRGEEAPDATSLLSAVAEKTERIPFLGWIAASPGRLLGAAALLLALRWFPILSRVAFHHAPILAAIAILAVCHWGVDFIPPRARPVIVALMLLFGIAGSGLGAVVWCWPFVLAAMVYGLGRSPQRVRTLLAYAAIFVALLAYLLPIYWITATSFKPPSQVFAQPPKLYPTHRASIDEPPAPGYAFGVTLQNYDSLIYHRENDEPTGRVIGYADFPGQLWNSLFIGLVSTLLAVSLGTMSAYAFARFRVRGKGDLLFFIVSTRMMPAIVAIIPIFLMYTALNLLSSSLGLIILYTAFNLSFSTYLLKGFFDDIPHEYDDAALLDGYSRLQVFRKISLPQALAGIAATAVFCFITAWNEFAFSQILSLGKPLTAPPSIVARTGASGVDWGPIAAGSVLFVIPAALFTFIMRKHLLRGVTFGAIKR